MVKERGERVRRQRPRGPPALTGDHASGVQRHPTSGVVLSTLREAADHDYQLTVLSDTCVDGDAEVQRVLIEKIFPRQAEILTVAEWSSRPAGGSGR